MNKTKPGVSEKTTQTTVAAEAIARFEVLNAIALDAQNKPQNYVGHFQVEGGGE